MKVWDPTGIKLTTPGSAVGLATDCNMGPSIIRWCGQTDDRDPMIIIAHLEPMAQRSLKAKSRWFNFASTGISYKDTNICMIVW